MAKLIDMTYYREVAYLPRYKKTATIRATPIHFDFTVQSKEGEILGRSGDYLAVADDDTPEKPHRWVISKEDFERTYERA